MALQIIKSNLGAALLQVAEQSPLPEVNEYLKVWHCKLQHELANYWQHVMLTQEVNDSFPSPHDFIHFIRPITSLSDGELCPDTSLWVPHTPDSWPNCTHV